MAIPPFRPTELMYNEKLTDYEFTDFIGVWKNFVPKSLCKEVIEYFEHVIAEGGIYIKPSGEKSTADPAVVTRSEDLYGGALSRKDYAFLLNYTDHELTAKVNSCLRACVLQYMDQYPQLKNIGLISTDIKAQKTPPGGGYHLWHYENSVMAYSMREITWMIYLNDMPDGEGETEFLYQRRRIKPTAGTVVMWPAGYTHVHKGNTVLTQDKYILTGWYIKNT